MTNEKNPGMTDISRAEDWDKAAEEAKCDRCHDALPLGIRHTRSFSACLPKDNSLLDANLA